MSWEVCPTVLGDLIRDPDPGSGAASNDGPPGDEKLDIAELVRVPARSRGLGFAVPLAGKRLRPSDRSIGILFMIGSALFGLGSFPIVNRWDERLDSVAFAVGALFFTSAATLQFIQSVAPPRPGLEPGAAGELPNIRGVEQAACGVQLIGTLWFNVMTINALAHNLTAEAARRRIWYPDVFGSICFLVASYLALAAVAGSWRPRWRGPRDLEGRIAELNWWGSLAFAVSAVGGAVLASGEDLNYVVATAGTFIGAVCFLLGARLMLPRVQRRRAAHTQ